MKPVIQEEKTGCAIASAAAIAGISYGEAKKAANALGIYAENESLWSDSRPIGRLLDQLGFKTGLREIPFTGWNALPGLALLSLKWYIEKEKPFWHRAVFVRQDGREFVLDSKKSLRKNMRTDFGRMKPKWYVEVKKFPLPHLNKI